MGNCEDDTTQTEDLSDRPVDLALEVPGLAAGVTDDDPTQITIIQQVPDATESGNEDGGSAGDAAEYFGACAPVGGHI